MPDRRTILFSLLLLAWIFWLYGGARIDLAYEDHAAFEQELSFYSSFSDRLVHALTYDRSHVLVPDLSGFARPLFWAYHALLEVVLDVDELQRGVIGLVVHWLVACTFYATARRWGSELVAWAATWSVATVYTGLNLVLWRHMLPYQLALAGIAIASSRPKTRVRSAALVAAVLFHEIVGVVALGASVFAAAVGAPDVRRDVLRLTAPAALVAVSLQIASLVSNGSVGQGTTTLASAVTWTPWVLGHWVLGWALPGTFFVLTEPFARSITRAVPLPPVAFSLLGIGAVAAFAVALLAMALRWRRGVVRDTDSALLLGGGTVMALAVVFAGLRIPMLSYDYLARSNYYFAFAGWLLSLIVVGVASGGPTLLRRATAAGFLLVTLISAQGVRTAVERDRDDVAAIYELHHAISESLGTDCLAGLADDADRAFFAESFPFAFLGRRTCALGTGRPMILSFERKLALVPAVSPTNWTHISHPFELAGAKAVRVVVPSPVDTSLRVTGGAHTFVVEARGHSTVAKLDGASIPAGRQEPIVGAPRATHVLEIAVIDANAYALYDGLAVASYGPTGGFSSASVSVPEAVIEVSPEGYALDHAAARVLDAPLAAAMAARIRSAR